MNLNSPNRFLEKKALLLHLGVFLLLMSVCVSATVSWLLQLLLLPVFLTLTSCSSPLRDFRPSFPSHYPATGLYLGDITVRPLLIQDSASATH